MNRGFETPRQIKQGHKPDYLILFCLGFLLIFGLIMLSSASSNLATAAFGDPYYYVKHQFLSGVLPGVIGFLIASKIYYGKYRSPKITIPFLIVTIILLGLVFTPFGFTAKGATRWITLGPLTFQPAELLKISLVLYLAGWLVRGGGRQKSFKQGLLPFLAILGFVSSFLILQRSTSPVAILVAVSMAMYFASGARWRYILGILLVSLIGLGVIIKFTDYRSHRILAFLYAEENPQTTGYHIIQAKSAIGAGGLTGVGYGQSTVKFRLPEPFGDSIFAVIAEEFGFVGSTVLIGVIMLLVLRMMLIAQQCRDKFGQLLLVGFGSIIAVQSIVNIGAMSGALPLTGTPLPFISYGGTALAIMMTMMGIVVNVTKYD